MIFNNPPVEIAGMDASGWSESSGWSFRPRDGVGGAPRPRRPSPYRSIRLVKRKAEQTFDYERGVLYTPLRFAG